MAASQAGQRAHCAPQGPRLIIVGVGGSGGGWEGVWPGRVLPRKVTGEEGTGVGGVGGSPRSKQTRTREDISVKGIGIRTSGLKLVFLLLKAQFRGLC